MAGLSSKASDTFLSSYRVQLPLGPGSTRGALPIALPRLDNLPGLRAEPEPRRKRLWELDPTLHYSIIGTCLTQGELREILRRIARRQGLAVTTPSDHELHSIAVRLAKRRDGPGKLLYKALARRHAATVGWFASAKDEAPGGAAGQAVPAAADREPCRRHARAARDGGGADRAEHQRGALSGKWGMTPSHRNYSRRPRAAQAVAASQRGARRSSRRRGRRPGSRRDRPAT